MWSSTSEKLHYLTPSSRLGVTHGLLHAVDVRELRGHDRPPHLAHARADECPLQAFDHFPFAELQPVRISVCARVLEGPALLAYQAADELHQHNRVPANHRVAAALRDLCHRETVAEILELEVARRRRRGCGNRGAGD